MSDFLLFPMGQFEARFPTDRRYAANHMWGMGVADGAVRFGFSAYAVRLMLDVYFLEWSVDEGTPLAHRQEIGAIESKKAESNLYAPMAGRLRRFNPELLSDPSGINVDPYGLGWLFEIDGSDETLMTPAAYMEHLSAVWEITRRNLRGQLG